MLFYNDRWCKNLCKTADMLENAHYNHNDETADGVYVVCCIFLWYQIMWYLQDIVSLRFELNMSSNSYCLSDKAICSR